MRAKHEMTSQATVLQSGICQFQHGRNRQEGLAAYARSRSTIPIHLQINFEIPLYIPNDRHPLHGTSGARWYECQLRIYVPSPPIGFIVF